MMTCEREFLNWGAIPSPNLMSARERIVVLHALIIWTRRDERINTQLREGT